MVRVGRGEEPVTARDLGYRQVVYIDRYCRTRRGFPALVAGLEPDLREIEVLTGRSCAEMLKIWVELETINAIALAEELQEPPVVEATAINSLLTRMKYLLGECVGPK